MAPLKPGSGSVAGRRWPTRADAGRRGQDGAVECHGDVLLYRQGLPWHYVLLGEDAVREWQDKGAHLADLLDFARLRPVASAAAQGHLL